MKRVFLFVLDSLGIGEEPDAAEFGDHDCNTLKRISQSPFFNAKNLLSLGLSTIDGVDYLPVNHSPKAAVARLREKSRGKDTTIGHWEISGIISASPLPTFPNGFPEDLLRKFSEETGREVLCNKPYSGTDVIRDYGEEHLKTGALIVYTSADSVFQIAANEAIVPIETLYEYCRIARKLLTGSLGVGRVIARPFIGTDKNSFVRTKNRRDFSLRPTQKTMLDAISEAGKTVYSIGKIYDIFAGQGITKYVLTHDNTEGMKAALSAQKEDFEGLCFINLVDFDMLYGHRQDIDGYAKALTAFDTFLPEFIAGMKDDDCILITADHGCDPGDDSTDHTREYIPYLLYGKSVQPVNYGTRETFADIGKTVTKLLAVPFEGPGQPMI